jgi:hypothetical protein
MFERDVVILDHTTRDKWPADVRLEVERAIELLEVGQDSYIPASYIPDEGNDDLGWDDEGIPHNSPFYKWLVENNVDFNKCYIHIWW